MALNNLCYIYVKLEDYGKALESQEKTYTLCREVFGDRHSNTLTALDNLAVIYSELEDYGKASELQEELYRLYCDAYGEDNVETIEVLDTLNWYKSQIR